ncbi:ribonuclease H-like domain-containing protein [Tanacetum coccineum]
MNQPTNRPTSRFSALMKELRNLNKERNEETILRKNCSKIAYGIESIEVGSNKRYPTTGTTRFIDESRKEQTINGNEYVGFDKSKVEFYNCHKKGHFAKECRAPRNQDYKNKESTRRMCLWKHPLPQIWCHVMVLVGMTIVIRQRKDLIMHSWLTHLQVLT